MTRAFADRLAALVEERRSQICLGLDPDPAKLAGRGRRRRSRRALAAERAAAAVVAPLPRPDRARRPRLRRGQAPARLLRAPRRPRLGGAGGGLRRRPRGRPAGRRRRQARRRPGHRRRLRAGAGRRDADALGPGRRARRRRLHRQPAARRSTRSSRWSPPRPRPAPGSSPWSAPATPAPPTSRTCRRRSGPCTSGSPALVDGLAERLLGESGPERHGRGRRRHRARAHRPPARADAALDLPDPRRRRPGRQAGAARRRLRAGRRPRPWSPPRAGSPPTPTRPRRRSACGPRSGTSPPPDDACGAYTISASFTDRPPVNGKTHQRLARILAAVALVGAVVVVIVVIAGSLGGSELLDQVGQRRAVIPRSTGSRRRRPRPTSSRAATP